MALLLMLAAKQTRQIGTNYVSKLLATFISSTLTHWQIFFTTSTRLHVRRIAFRLHNRLIALLKISWFYRYYRDWYMSNSRETAKHKLHRFKPTCACVCDPKLGLDTELYSNYLTPSSIADWSWIFYRPSFPFQTSHGASRYSLLMCVYVSCVNLSKERIRFALIDSCDRECHRK